MALTGYIKNGDKFEKIGVSDNIPVGLILPWFLNKDVPVGFIRVLDTWYDSATYPTLDAMYGDTYGRQNGKFRLPPVWDNRFLEGGSIAGELKDAGLPNIEGRFQTCMKPVTTTARDEGQTIYGVDGAFYGAKNNPSETTVTDTSASYMRSTSTSYSNVAGFDASRSNSIYGNSDTVQPKAITVVWIIKAFEGASPKATDLEITNVANDLIRLKGNFDNSVRIVETYRNGVNWYNLYSNGFIEQGGQQDNQTAPINLLVEMADTNYSVTLTSMQNTNWGCVQGAYNKTTTKFDHGGTNANGTNSYLNCEWVVKGYAKVGV